jgi:N-methylhydantoinase A/oxoprolinase/acetone carboxylase beta subunit
MWRHVARSVTEEIELPAMSRGAADPSAAEIGSHPMYLEPAGGFVPVPAYDGGRLAAGMEIAGPATVVAADTTIVLPAETSLRVSDRGYYEMRIGV